jgi:hypothetical protein
MEQFKNDAYIAQIKNAYSNGAGMANLMYVLSFYALAWLFSHAKKHETNDLFQ